MSEPKRNWFWVKASDGEWLPAQYDPERNLMWLPDFELDGFPPAPEHMTRPFSEPESDPPDLPPGYAGGEYADPTKPVTEQAEDDVEF